MIEVITPSAALFMKVGYHASEDLDSILRRKLLEEHTYGFFFWGYGGSVSHPTRQVIPFALGAVRRRMIPWLVLSMTPSRFDGESRSATEFSIDGSEWYAIPERTLVTGSRYALLCQRLEHVSFKINLSEYSVAVGPSKGRRVSEYLRARVDKACAYRRGEGAESSTMLMVSLRAQLMPPYAVLIR